ncbi:MAG: PIN domain-containing protein [Nitrosopumilus sp.]
MVEVICDTNFLIHLATRQIRNLDKIELDIGNLTFLIPTVVKNELLNLKKDKQKEFEIKKTLDFIKKFKTISINGTYADKEIINYTIRERCFVGTMDKKLKKEIKKNGSKIISFSNDNLILEF